MFQQVRKINPTRRSVSGAYPFRGQMVIPYESSLERDFIIKQEFDNKIIELIPQPASIPFVLNNQTYLYTPDFLVIFDKSLNKKGILAEIKPESEWRKNWRKWFSKWKAAYSWANEHNFTFHIFDEVRIRDTCLDNIKLLNRFKTHFISNGSAIEILKILDNVNQPMAINCLLKHFPSSEHKDINREVLHLLATQLLKTDMQTPISTSSLIWLTRT